MKISYKGAFGEWLSNQLITRRITITKFSEEIGISKQHVHKHLTGKAYPHKSTLIRYADYFHTDLNFLIKMTCADVSHYG